MPRYSSEAAFSSSPLSAPASSPRKPIFVDESESDVDRVGTMDLEDEADEEEADNEVEDDTFEVEAIVARKGGGDTGRKLMYKIRWKGYSAADDTWEPIESIQAVDLIRAFEEKDPQPIYGSAKKRGKSRSTSTSSRAALRASSVASSSRTRKADNKPPNRPMVQRKLEHETVLYRTPPKVAQEWLLPTSTVLSETVFNKIRRSVEKSPSRMIVIHPASIVKLRTKTSIRQVDAVFAVTLKQTAQMVKENELSMLSHRAFPLNSPFKGKALYDIVDGKEGYKLAWNWGLLNWEDEYSAYTLHMQVDASKRYRVLVRKIKPNMKMVAEKLQVELVDIEGFMKERTSKGK